MWVTSPSVGGMAISNPELPVLRTWSNLPGHEQIRDVVGAVNLSRGTALARAGRVRWITTDAGRHLLYATVDDAGPKQVLVHAGDALGVRRSTGRCTCSRPVGCEHVAAVLIAALDDFGHGAPDTPPAWERALAGLIGEGRQETGDVPIGLQFEPVPGKPGTAHHLRIRLRPVIPGRKGWVRTGTSWRDLAYTWSHPDQSKAHREALHLLHQAHQPTAYSYGEPAVHLDDFGPALWPLLRDAADAGVPFVHARASAGAVALADEPAVVALDLGRDASGDVTATTVVDVPGSTDDAAPAAFIGQPAHGVVVDLGAASGPLSLLLAPLHKPLDRKASGVLSVGELRVPAEDVTRFLAEYYPALRRVVEMRSSDGSVELPAIAPPRLGLRLTYADARSLTLEWSFLYENGARRVPLSGADPFRDRLAEQRLLRDLRLPEPLLAGPGMPGPAPRADLTGIIVALFTSETVPELEEQGVVIEVVGTPGEYRRSDSEPIIRVSATDSEDADWFDLGVTVEIDGEEVPFARLFVALAQGEDHLLLDSGTWFRIDRPELDRLRELIEEAQFLVDRESNGLRLSVYQAGLWEEFASLGIVEEQSARWLAAVDRLLGWDTSEPPAVPAGLLADLRPYQLDGYRWLSQLWDAGLGGILADDMGLGKTLQALAAIVRAKEAGTEAPVLVVAPASVVGNWVAEAGRFAPGLSGVAVTETERKAGRRAGRTFAERVEGADVVVTSYQLFRIDEAAFRTVAWSALILDEAQFVKNHQAKTYQCARRLPAPFKVAITGTPLENSLMDLWSLLSIVAPGMYPDPKAFTENYRKPIERGGAPELLATLHRRIRPFIRRRTKEQVAADLPPKQEQVLRVELNPRHRRIYDTHLQRERRKVLSLLDDVQKNRFTILRSLTLLRQLSLDASLVDEQYHGVASSKIEVFLEQLDEVIAGGHRALVFSQFTSFLGRVRDRLDAAGIDYCYLDGRTRNRARRVEEFKTGSAPVFLISLKAGGFGLNLTEADYCFVLDPWWNPAAEAQAVDRTHRIGQDKNVMVYRLVADQTIEEKVLALQARKRDLFDAVVNADGDLSAPLSASDIRELLTV